MNHALAPARLVRGQGVLAELGSEVARLGRRPLLIHGALGYGQVQLGIDATLHGAVLDTLATMLLRSRRS